MIAELQIENYTDEDSFESFYKKNKRRIVNALKGKKMKRRHLRNARKILKESVDLPEPVKDDILIGAIDDTVSEAVQEGYTGEDFDYLDFARKIRKRAEKKVKKPIEKLRFEKLRRVFRKKPKQQVPPASSPNISSMVNKVSSALKEIPSKEVPDEMPLEDIKQVQEVKANIVQTNGQLASPKITGVGDEAIAQAEKQEETAQTPSGEQAAPQQEAAAPKEESAKAEKPKEDQSKEGEKPKPNGNKKWLYIGGAIGAVLLVILIIVLVKSNSNVTVTKVQ